MKSLEFIQTCISGRTPLLRHYEEARTRQAGKELKKLIVQQTEFDNFAIFEDYAVSVETMKYQKESYIIVTHSQVNYIYKIHNDDFIRN